MRSKPKLIPACLPAVTVALLMYSCWPTYSGEMSSSDCDQITILDTGAYRIRHSKIGGLGIFHRLGGPVTDVLIWPSTEDSREISRIYLVQDLEHHNTPVCKLFS